MNEKQQQLTFDKGITNVPSDVLCSDNALTDSLGLVYDNGEHRVIQKPAEFITSGLNSGDVLLFVHKLNNQERYIIQRGSNVIWATKSGTTLTVNIGTLASTTGSVKVEALGKTLVIADDSSMTFLLWEENDYENISATLPEPNIRFRVAKVDENNDVNNIIRTWQDDVNDFVNIAYDETTQKYIAVLGGDQAQESYNDLVVGLYEKCVKEATEKKYFVKPFAIRYAIELKSGDFYLISNPILLFPASTDNILASLGYDGSMSYASSSWLNMRVLASKLQFTASYDYSKWSDIIKGVSVFISPGVNLYDTIGTQNITQIWCSDHNNPVPTALPNNNPDKPWANLVRDSFEKQYTFRNANDDEEKYGGVFFVPINKRTETNIRKDLAESSQFYKLFSLDIRTVTSDWTDAAGYMDEHVLENLTTQDRIVTDDYFSRTDLSPKVMKVYNARLNIANLRRSFFEGFNFFTHYYLGQSHDFISYVTIDTDSGQRIIKNEYSSPYRQNLWFYYPDSRAKHVKIFQRVSNVTTLCILNEELTEHPFLNGAYYFYHMPNGSDTPSTSSGSQPNADNTPEYLPNNIVTSEVNAPFLFLAKGYFQVGNGQILALSTTTMALAQDQFGKRPLLVFTDSGVLGAEVGREGYFLAVDPFTRDVLDNNGNNVVQTDGAVFFTSKKGLMVATDAGIKCVSEQLIGSFSKLLEKAFFAYDYRDSLLWIFDGESRYCYVYAIKNGSFARYDFGAGQIVSSVVNLYPDYLIQIGTNVYSLIQRDNIAEDTGYYTASLVSRPMKLENGLALKSIMQVRHILQFTPYTVGNETQKGTMTLRIFASNNLDPDARTWVELHSLRGTPWKYYRFQYDFSNMKATDRFAGTMLITQERRTNKLR